jgi:hypothetical protein
MRILIATVIFFFGMTSIGLCRNQPVHLIHKKDSLLKIYKSHVDTITVNTWLNIRKSNQYLERIVYFDSLIIKSLSNIQDVNGVTNDTKAETASPVFEFDTLHSLKEIPAGRAPKKSKNQKENFFLIIIGISIIAFLIFYSVLIKKRLKVKEGEFKQSYTDLYAARQEIENLEKTNTILASDINRLTKELAGVEDSIKLLQHLQDEKALLENQILEVRKAYILEVDKRKELETRLQNLESDKNDEIALLKSDIQNLEDGLSEAESLRSMIVKEFNTLIEKIKNRFT